ncbi:hypothetical protein KY290_021208 [Solanum tuberosum]|uniref:Uncharacterized protein n=1 Tax=Solanum tuberosum TaxID=4113 RepID=A0ABQ7V0W7_SOLTU|nr:hypothetical protein KY289_020376 [Solanum tuberosum]KAH0693036.1 hypothetical protein KY285_020133 [Solanum tuberosum]KAH0757715.1 hypothetical protein KY290_021208 [Solanum tuberosum]
MEPSNGTSAYRFLNKHSFLDFTSNKLSPYGVRPREKSNTQALELICQSTITTNLYFELKRLRSFPSR